MLPKEDWLHLAKSLRIGSTARYQHGRERRTNLVVGNESGKWWAYCNACKEGGVVDKEHVRVTGTHVPKKSTELSLPSDAVPLGECAPAALDQIAAYLVRKNMDTAYLPALSYTAERKRLLVYTEQGVLGRDLTDKSMQKWVTYNGSTYLAPLHSKTGPAIVVEDAFSYYKVAWALRHTDCTVTCALGTRISHALLLRLMNTTSNVLCMFDGDEAGYAGANYSVRALRPFFNVRSACAPSGLDPKDMSVLAIQDWYSNWRN